MDLSETRRWAQSSHATNIQYGFIGFQSIMCE